MHLLQFLRAMNPSFDPEDAKLHLATHSETLNMQAFEIYIAGEFDAWQRWNNPGSFNRDLVISLISLPPREDGRWLFAGVHRCHGGEETYRPETDCDEYKHNLTEEQHYAEMNGRLVVEFERIFRQSYAIAANWIQDIIVREIYPKRLSIGAFPGFKAVNISREQLEIIFEESLESWRAALSNVAGIYLIMDTATGKPYVGSAYGDQGIWGRWSEYADNADGGNVELQYLLEQEGREYVRNFRYAILEISDPLSSDDEIRHREDHWKEVLMTRTYGLNAN